MPAAEDSRGIFRAGKAPGAADAGCIGKPGVTPQACLRHDPGAEKPSEADPPVFSNGL
jgi:hypothetical protein